MQNNRLLIMLEIAFMAGLSIILSYIEFSAPWAMGGSISLVMVPIFIIAFRRGWKAGMMTGFLTGILQILFGAIIVHPIQFILEYPIAYAVLGLAGLFVSRNNFKHEVPVFLIIIGVAFGTLLRFIDHFSAGLVWFGEYAPDGVPVVTYSAVYNASYLVPEMLITIFVVILISKYRPQFFYDGRSVHSAA
ncbi:energy-coupled thiamine transporter ThiT [Alteribacillus bidgolensis]|uniref:Thiamine transporter n=1 Tax=Alteribacillus bidgolensis TaxID=930129 RepID=A0A1G8IPI6_9BACI|nr:energy-coupled thiamine transporter ThiT [Alteribacillus bidgolensis]SDI20721.1 thiamine transporter [Alteribacillus bidgolensis]